MQEIPVRTIIDEITDFLATNPTPDEIIAYRLPDELEKRAHDLLDKNGEGELTVQEEAEMMDFAQINQIMSLLKAKTRLKLRNISE